MGRIRSIFVVALVLATLSGAAGATTTAEGETNDTVATALTIGELPYSHATFTDGAVDNTDDAGGCFGDDSGYSVWYRYTPAADTSVRFATAGSEFDTVLEVFAGEQRELVTCNDDGGWELDSLVMINAVAGETYLIRAAGLGGERGYLEFSAAEAIPMAADLEVAEQGTLRTAKSRIVLSGVLTCNQDGLARVTFVASQGAGPLASSGRRVRYISCSEEERPFTVNIKSREGRFLPGPADVEWSGSACVGGGGGVVIIGTEPDTEPGSTGAGGAEPGSEGTTTTSEHEEDPSCAPVEGTQSVTAIPATPQ